MKPSEDWDGNIPQLAERALGYTFQNKALLKQCFTHKSYGDSRKEEHNERLEFLGDAVLQLAVSEALFLSRNTVKSYQKSIYAKLGVHSKQEIIELIAPSR